MCRLKKYFIVGELSRKPAFLMMLFIVCYVGLLSPSNSSERVEQLAQEGKALLDFVDSEVFYEAISSAVPEGVTIEEFEERQYTTFEQTCLKSYVDKQLENMRELAANAQSSTSKDKMQVIKYGKKQALQIEHAFKECAKSLGLNTSVREVLRDGRKLTFTEIYQHMDLLVAERDEVLEQERLVQEWLIYHLFACGKRYNYDVSGYCDGEYVYGEIDACSDSKEVSGHLYDEDGEYFDFDGEWDGQGQVSGTDSDGNYCDLEVD
ncbi:MAG: hypothetical protein JAZ17_03530 [Candidatus Thiodiazotropha endolucinida]|nr:hypothetical protein [Candidatus Thiodiazotropha taylori]MCG8092692.1 hypothetical protein [Candidatus Thiodiazotropha endolucinida]MCG8046025.1 hypothetical protein [Candidatus Thiodiazotropha taylori]MCG8053130.1 hypothetical protein [Candidatus Thiodiazotropha taylori]MCG8072797.1 hypothetical protein [Candidatus Thiodiazotropha taylori]